MTKDELDDLRAWSVELQDPCETSGSNRLGALLAKLLTEFPAEPKEEPHSVVGSYCADCGGPEMHMPYCRHVQSDNK